jgi:hypothetical protein
MMVYSFLQKRRWKYPLLKGNRPAAHVYSSNCHHATSFHALVAVIEISVSPPMNRSPEFSALIDNLRDSD